MMNIKELSKEEAVRKLNNYFKCKEDYFDSLNSDYKKIRMDLLYAYEQSKVYKDQSLTSILEYETDLKFACQIYVYFNNLPWFNETIASNYDFWRYICVCIAPDIIEQRHGRTIDYYYNKNVRLYFPTMWWYIHMSFNNDLTYTYESLRHLNTDYILQLVERPGKEGMYLSISRRIMYYICRLEKKILEHKIDKKNLLRRVMIQNTSKINNYNLVFDSNEDLYVKRLFSSCGVEV